MGTNFEVDQPLEGVHLIMRLGLFAGLGVSPDVAGVHATDDVCSPVVHRSDSTARRVLQIETSQNSDTKDMVCPQLDRYWASSEFDAQLGIDDDCSPHRRVCDC